jgi:hypothetical protein
MGPVSLSDACVKVGDAARAADLAGVRMAIGEIQQNWVELVVGTGGE